MKTDILNVHGLITDVICVSDTTPVFVMTRSHAKVHRSCGEMKGWKTK